MADTLSGVRDEALALTRDALVVDIHTTSFGLAIRSLKAGGNEGVQGSGCVREALGERQHAIGGMV